MNYFVFTLTSWKNRLFWNFLGTKFFPLQNYMTNAVDFEVSRATGLDRNSVGQLTGLGRELERVCPKTISQLFSIKWLYLSGKLYQRPKRGEQWYPCTTSRGIHMGTWMWGLLERWRCMGEFCFSLLKHFKDFKKCKDVKIKIKQPGGFSLKGELTTPAATTKVTGEIYGKISAVLVTIKIFKMMEMELSFSYFKLCCCFFFKDQQLSIWCSLKLEGPGSFPWNVL